jgi:hypothetical protein
MTYAKVLKAALALTPHEQNELIGRIYGHLQEIEEAPLSRLATTSSFRLS